MSENSLQKLMDDFSLESVPKDSRRPWTEIAAVQVGIVSSLAVLMTGGLVTFMAGFWMGMLAAFCAFIISTVFIFFMGMISYSEGYSSNIISRAYAFGTKGSAIGSLIWAFMIIGFLGLENVLIGHSLLFYFGIEKTTAINVIMYILMAVFWIVLSLFGIKLVAKVAQLTIPILFIVLGYIVYLLVEQGNFSEVFSFGVMIPGLPLSAGFGIALNATITLAGLITIVATDFTRFARSKKDVLKVSVSSGVAMYGLTMFFGAVITYFGHTLSKSYFVNQGMSEAEAINAAIVNPGITLVLAGGVIGMLAIIFSQAKVQVGNSYEGALALVNLFDVLFKWTPGRAVMVVFANIISLIFIFGNILHYIEMFLAIGSVLLGVWVIIVLTDYYLIKGKLGIGDRGISDLKNIRNFNFNGIATLIVSTSVGMVIHVQGWFSVPFIISILVAFVMYTSIAIFTNNKQAVLEERKANV
ncbi:cytosine/purines uracil thiamine allantoin permease [Bacillus freudenreichii]|nr:cytosine/purines uracil thiamine allantoin permease [Bacillus freudenreichii]